VKTARHRTDSRSVPFAFLGLICLLLALPLLAQTGGQAEEMIPAEDLAASENAEPGDGEGGEEEDVVEPEVVVVRIALPIHPVSAQILADAVAEAESARASALVVELDTPGGLLTSTREMIQDILATDVPVVVYVAPQGAQAASAGFFLLMASDVAAMAPGTNAGAASPVGGQGEDIEGTMGEKVEQDASAQIRSLAKRNGRNVELAEAAVTEARSYDAEEALEVGLIEVIAPSLPQLLQELDGRTIRDGEAETRLATRGAAIRRLEPTPVQSFLALLADPNIAYLLLSIGSIGIMVEIYNPGAIFPGVIGAICLVLGFFALSVLPVNVAGLALLGLALIFFIVEVKVTSYGLLTVAGVVSLVIGSLMLFRSPDPALRVSLELIAAAAVTTIVVVLFLMYQVLRAHRTQVRTGIEGMVHERGRAQSDLDPVGKVFVHGEIWDAEAETPVSRGEAVEVVAVQGMWLRVKPLAESGRPGASPDALEAPLPEHG
jgi:membrane-bound serine protease (ClpP class)